MTSNSEILPVRVNWNFEIFLTLVGLAFTVAATSFLAHDLGVLLNEKIVAGATRQITEQVVFSFIVCGLIYGNFIYQVSRLGFLLRDKKHKKETVLEMAYLFQDKIAPSITILVPSYKEDIRVIYQTLMSAALQQYPEKRIVLLLDDPPFPKTSSDSEALRAARDLPEKIQEILGSMRLRFEREKNSCLGRISLSGPSLKNELSVLVALYEEAAVFLQAMADSYEENDHTGRLFSEKILRRSAEDFRKESLRLKQRGIASRQELIGSYNRLVGVFSVEISVFERKKYENLSHESNKAMNLNTYIGLMGRSFHEVERKGKIFLEECAPGQAVIDLPDSEFVITLDADSMILPDYAQRLVHTMLKEGHEKYAVVQTPYSAVPGAENPLERIAGATTDIQLLVHQGFTWAGASFWVGANALLRKRALEDIKVIEQERGYSITRYIHDRTVIEDTESSIDLVDAGWVIYNYPARLAYSATPPDFGSLLIQRRRWANGGLIIAPKLLRHIVKTISFKKLAEGIVRFHYLVSIALGSGGVLVLILYPFDNVMRTWWLPLTSVPYFYFYGRDLRLSGYKWSDLLRVYALNLMLVSVNLGGVLKSIEQGIMGNKIPFVRTPKVQNRTASPPLYAFSEFLILGYCLGAAAVDIYMGYWAHASFAVVNAAFLYYACTYFLGWKEGFQDMRAGLKKENIIGPVQVVHISAFDNNHVLRKETFNKEVLDSTKKAA